jgi:dimeric dUTPase (all-alpha-NTP-PPase superfamily)
VLTTLNKDALLTMLDMQQRMNSRVHDEWIEQDFEWYRAIWIECGELIEHFGYKWWKKQDPDLPQVQLEVIDIWHFGMSALFTAGADLDTVADRILVQLRDHQPSDVDVRAATEELALHSLQTHSFCAGRFSDLMRAAELDFDSLYRAYVGKNVLNFFRQDHGYKDGSYSKNWAGREDNEHLVELVAELDSSDAQFADSLYQALAHRYAQRNS